MHNERGSLEKACFMISNIQTQPELQAADQLCSVYQCFQTDAKCHVHHLLFPKGRNVEQKGDTPGVYQVLKFS